MCHVSVVIPVYKVESYIERCLHTLFGQTLEEIEYIFVDDGSPDASVVKIGEVLEQYPHRKSQTKLLRHDRNRGVAAARTTGIRAATGEYLIHCDPDDYVEPDMYEKLYAKAKETDADVVVCDYWLEKATQKKVVTPAYRDTPQQCLKDMYKKDGLYMHLWSKLVRRRLISRYTIVPFAGTDYGEDLNCTMQIFYYAKHLAVVRKPLYHYCQREGSLSISSASRAILNRRMDNAALICRFLQEKSGDTYETFCNHMKFCLKRQYQSVFDENDYEWFHLYRESHNAVLSLTLYPLKTRVILWIALQHYILYRIMKKFISGL